MEKQTILFDLDDTLIHCNKYFDLVVEQFVDLMNMYFHGHNISMEEIKKKQAEVDLARVLEHGFDPNHFPESFVDTYDYFSELTDRPREIDETTRLIEIGKTVYGHSIEPYPFMEDTLIQLESAGHELHLYTGGDRLIQMRKVTEANLERFFGHNIHVTRHKSTEFLENLLTDHQLDRKTTWMIGNSLRTDVIPALKTGINAIFMPAIQEWAYNNVAIDVEPQGAFFTLSSLNEIPSAIHSYRTSRASNE